MRRVLLTVMLLISAGLGLGPGVGARPVDGMAGPAVLHHVHDEQPSGGKPGHGHKVADDPHDPASAVFAMASAGSDRATSWAFAPPALPAGDLPVIPERPPRPAFSL
jgi:hypothetical protein